jgi:2-amino-4-hydroxy-6-hydroxymethyldihydropteridine diphosphokinase
LNKIDKSNPLDRAVVVAAGSNLAGRWPSSRALLDAALDRFAGLGLTLTRRSRWWRSRAWPEGEGPDYLNGVVIVETRLPPATVMAALIGLEASFERLRTAPNAPRTLDLDLIAYGRCVVTQPGLVLPHPRAAGRLFVLGPLAEIAPEWTHPTLGRSAAEMAASPGLAGADAEPLHA